MDKIKKFLKKLNAKEYEAFLLLFEQIGEDYTKVPHLLKMQGLKNCYRVRFGKYRIIFVVKNGLPKYLKITKRNDQTYENL